MNNNELIHRCELLVQNRKAIQKVFKWENDAMLLAGSSFYVGMDLEADTNRLKFCEDVLKRKTGIFSAYRGNTKMPILCKMATKENPEQYFAEIDEIVHQMKDIKWIDNDYKILSAMTLRDHTEMDNIPECLHEMLRLYEGMKKNHPWLTDGEDVPFAALLVTSGMDVDVLLDEMERCYQDLGKKFRNKNAVQSLSHVLAVNPVDTTEKCQRVEDIFNQLKEQKHKYPSGFELAVLGTLAMLNVPTETLVEEIIDADDFLKKQEGFGTFNVGTEKRRMYAALMVMDTHMPPADTAHESLVNSVLALVIAMEVCILILMTTTATTIVTAN